MPARRNLSRIIFWLTAAMIAVGVLGVPLGFVATQYTHVVATLGIEAEVTAEQVSRLIGLNPVMWRFEEVRLASFLVRPARDRHRESRRILDRRGQVVAEHPEPLPRPLLTRAAPLYDAGVEVGRLEISRSFRPALLQGALLLLASLAGGALLYAVLALAPLRTLARAETALREAREELERQNVELQKVDRIKDSLIHDVTHELKTPVAKQSMQLEILRSIARREGFDQHVAQSLAVMEGCVRRQSTSIRNILDLSRLEAGGRKFRRDTFRLDALLREVLDEYAHDFERHGIELRASLPELRVTSDQEMLWHAFSNVMTNAIKFTQGVAGPRIDVTLVPGPGLAEIVFADNGEGLSEEERAGAFTRFYKGTPSKEGSGIGLNISQGILAHLGGAIAIDSPGKGKGAVVRVTLPLEHPAA